MINTNTVDYEMCKKCEYYYGEIDECMFGEPDVPDNMERMCKNEKVENPERIIKMRKFNIENIVNNVNIYGLDNSFRVSKYPMATDVNKCTTAYTPTIKKLGSADQGSGHDNFLKGIIVQFDLSFTIKAWTEAERYHWFDIVSSQSTMHKISAMDYDVCMCGYITDNTKKEIERLRDIYNKTKDQEDYLTLLYNCPTGLILTAGITTNYQQLKTIYHQRKNHRLPEWRIFCDWINTLPYSELITGEDNE